jgi:hypothetical protein
MKLLHCTECKDVVALHLEVRTCLCGKSRGCYTNRVHALYSGPARIIAFRNYEFLEVTMADKSTSKDFSAFTISAESGSIEEVENL